jgi:hypothetical protein
MVSLKDRRNSGRYTPTATASPKELKEENIEIPVEYDDWQDHRDGFRAWHKDNTQIVNIHKRKNWIELINKKIKMVSKEKKLLKIRKARKNVKNTN